MSEQPVPEVHYPEEEWTWEPDPVPFSELGPGGGVVRQVSPAPGAEAEAG